ncbi:acylaminoacyl-peptidase [Pseudoalteromonas sp. MSK9-3]|uniref:S9 family peptidase n=1 Tax=Pseudoalteromonas sp. MSK9-3 TaxID=1897633 RepID=UPI000E6D28F5|nr:prolyl oligopeptidase family serine peptidase [Pseudoalteromonas sp. MSK9-3]RJE77915.1 acylaminoacyl-peptidase [Pseudoalteromonas sp. MSK9-3]
MIKLTSLAMTSLLLSNAVHSQQSLEFKDVFDFSYANNTQLSENGAILSFSAAPYRGDPVGHVYTLDNNTLLAQVERGIKPAIAKNATWVAFTQSPSLLKKETATKKEKKQLTNNLVLVNTKTQKQLSFSNVKDYQLSNDGSWLTYREQLEPEKKTNANESKSHIGADKKDKHYPLVIVNLANNQTHRIEQVGEYALSPNNHGVIFAQSSDDGSKNQIGFFDLDSQIKSSLFEEPGVTLSQALWHPTSPTVAFNMGNYINDDVRRRDYKVTLWDAHDNKLTYIDNPKGWFSAKTAKLVWSESGERLYFQNRPLLENKAPELKYSDKKSLSDYDTIRAQKGLKVWHNADPEIKPREIKTWKETNKHRHYHAVYHINSQHVAQLSTPQVKNLTLHTEAQYLLGSDNTAHLKEVMYNGFFQDYYAINVQNGNKTTITTHTRFKPTLSPTGNHAAYFEDKQIWLKDLATQQQVSLTNKIDTAIFADDKHDYPKEQSSYRFAGWQVDGSTLYAYSKHDIWAFDVTTAQATRLTNGQATNTQYRVRKLNKTATGYTPEQTLVLSAHNLNNKQTHIATLSLKDNTVRTVLKDAARFDVVKRAKHSDKLLFTKQSYHEFPDFWQVSSDFKNPQKITDLNPQVSQFAWGQKPELVQYKGHDGEDLQGVLIKPAGYKKGDKLPVVIYFYRYMSQRMYDFPKMELNHRPNFPMFTSNGYALFLPDIRFEIGKPGPSSTQTMINAAQKLIDIGVAHPDKIGLQGHSWAGYQSAYMITQTDMFKAIVSGAPVTNMTSAYSGIRLKSGLARQFQYETGQSRIGKPLHKALDLYIENSPVFFADKVNTPILMMFGDKDGAVPWQEGIQYYLALRRLDKDAILLQYEGEPHHLKKFPNQLDFSIRMMEYFDFHLKGEQPKEWITKGQAYTKE